MRIYIGLLLITILFLSFHLSISFDVQVVARLGTKSLSKAAFSPDNETFTLTGLSDFVRVFRTKSLEQIYVVPTISKVFSFNHNGTYIATGSNNNNVIIWDTNVWKKVLSLTGHRNQIMSLSFSPSKTYFASADVNKIILWDTYSWEKIDVFNENIDTIRFITFSFDDKYLIYGHSTGIRVIDLLSRHKMDLGQNHVAICSAKFSNDNKFLAVRETQGTISIYTVNNWKKVTTLSAEVKNSCDLAFSPDGKQLVVDEKKNLNIYNMSNGNKIKSIFMDSNSIVSMDFNSNGELLLIGSKDPNALILFNTSDWKQLGRINHHSKKVDSISYAKNEPLLASRSEDGTIILWETMTWKKRFEMNDSINVPSSIAFSPNDSFLVYCSKNGSIIIRSSKDPSNFTYLKSSSSNSCFISFHKNGKFLAIGKDSIEIWDMEKQQLVKKLKNLSSSVSTVSFSAHTNILGAGLNDGSLLLWDTKSWKKINQILAHKNKVTSLKFLDNTQLVTGSYDKTLALWNVSNLKKIKEICTDEPILSLTANPHLNLLISGSPLHLHIPNSIREHIISFGSEKEAFSIKLWDMETWTAFLEIQSFNVDTTSLAFDHSNKFFASGHKDGTVTIWDISGSFSNENRENKCDLMCIVIIVLALLITGFIIKKKRKFFSL